MSILDHIMPETWPSASHVSTYLNRFRDIVVEHCGLNKKERNKERRKEGKKERKKDRKKERKEERRRKMALSQPHVLRLAAFHVGFEHLYESC